LTDDTTPEALAVQLAANGERIGLFSAEGGPFELMAGRYSEKGTNFEIYLKAHPGDAHIVTRIRRDPLSLQRPLLTMCLTVQPSVIAGLATKDGFRARGLLARFLYALPRTTLGKRTVDSATVAGDVATSYAARLRTVLETAQLVGGLEGMTLHMSPTADRARAALQQAIEPRLGPDGDLAPIADWAGKMVGAVCRIACVLHVADHADTLRTLPVEIPLVTFARATAIGEFYLEHARAAFSAMGSDETTQLAKRVWAWVVRGKRREFSAYDAKRGTHATPETIALALVQLAARNLVRPLPEAEPTGGRPSGARYEVRP
jgi:hypothetical protein